MAVDEALLREVDGPVLRLYEWSAPAVSIGYFQPAALVPEERTFVRRYTGGGLVDHARDFTYTVVLPRAHPWMELSAPDSYCLIHRGVQAALAACGIESEIAPAASTAESDACFQKPVRFDVMAAGEGLGKLSGAAQRRTREGLLHQGSILLPDPEQNGRLRGLFANTFSARLEVTLAPGDLTAPEIGRAEGLSLDRYATDGWNRMR
jgi:lipoate-protein ligase A